uniref:Zmp:0000000760 n=1 Tax=Oncorhynchus tshawytscha TaxID=74940 RepID=A0A8C8EU26_ONCTS
MPTATALSSPSTCPLPLHCSVLPTCYDMLEEFRVFKSRGVRKVDGSEPDSVSDTDGREQVGLHFQGDTRSLDFFYTSPSGTQMLRTFHRVEKLFNGEWHKLALQVKGDKVRLLVDCEEVSVEPIDNPRPIIHQGYTSIVKRAVGDRSASVDLQQMDVSCNPEKTYSEDCCELSSVCGGYAEIGLTAGRATCTCMPGQPGNQGPPGPKGHRGLPGNTGEPGRLGNWGGMGQTGDYGHVGEPGAKGIEGIKGNKGMRGLHGLDGDRGPKGLKGLQGAGGFKVDCVVVRHEACGLFKSPRLPFGLPTQHMQIADNTNNNISLQGIIGDPGLPGRDGDIGVEVGSQSFIIHDKCFSLQGPRGYKGSAAKPGRPGFIGPPGPVGHVGVAGRPGPKVINVIHLLNVCSHDLFPQGPTLPSQHVIEVCKRVVLEQMSTFANSVKRTCAAVCPLYGDVPLGAPGPTGQKGTPGPPGGNGIDGRNGEIGQPGFYGEAGDTGKQGQLGDQGDEGDEGAKGHGLPGYIGDQGPKGQRGRPGRTFNGTPGREGERGHVGRPGLRGHPGLRGVPGVCQTTGCALLNNNTTNGSHQNAPQRLRRHP